MSQNQMENFLGSLIDMIQGNTEYGKSKFMDLREARCSDVRFNFKGHLYCKKEKAIVTQVPVVWAHSR